MKRLKCLKSFRDKVIYAVRIQKTFRGYFSRKSHVDITKVLVTSREDLARENEVVVVERSFIAVRSMLMRFDHQ